MAGHVTATSTAAPVSWLPSSSQVPETSSPSPYEENYAANATRELHELCEVHGRAGAHKELGLGSLREILSLLEGLRLAVERVAVDHSRQTEPVQRLDRALVHLKGFFEKHPLDHEEDASISSHDGVA